MLFGSLAASIPIALHFFFRSRYRTVPWAAMKFLLASIEQTSRRLKFQELLLLLLRITLLVLLALALARPLSSSVRGAAEGGSVHAVFLFDTSMSMGASDGAKTRFERAQDTAISILDQLPPHSTVQIISCADRAELNASASESSFTSHAVLGLMGPRYPENLDQARTIIKDLAPTSLGTDLNDGISLAAAALEQENGNRELYIFTDVQKIGWTTQPDKIKKTMSEIGQKSSITLVRCGQQEPNNAAIVKVVPQTNIPRPGERVDFAVQVAHTSGNDIKDLQLTLLVDGQDVVGQSKAIALLKKNETQTITMTGKLEKPGLHTISVLMSKDDIPGDNRYDYVVRVPDIFRVLIVDGGDHDPEDRENPKLASSYYVMHQIAPVAEADYGRFYIQQTRVRARSASAALLAPANNLPKPDLCVLVNCKMPLPKADDQKLTTELRHGFLTQLETFVEDGGSLLIYSGDKVDYRDYNNVLGDKYHLLPVPIKGKAVEFPRDPVVSLSRKSFNFPDYQKFKDDKQYEGFKEIEIYKAFPVIVPVRNENRADKNTDEKKRLEQEKREANVTIVLEYSNGWPAVISRRVGEGEVMFVTTAAEPGVSSEGKNAQFLWNNWALNGLSGPFVKNTLAHFMARSTGDHNFEAGRTLVWNARDKFDKSFTLYFPRAGEPEKKDKTPAKQNVPRKLERLGSPVKDPDTGKYTVRATGLYQAGIYNIRAMKKAEEGKDDETDDKHMSDSLPVAVIPDLAETKNLEAFTDDDFDKFLEITPAARHLLAGSGTERSTGADRFNREWTLWFLWALLILGMCECALAYWCGKAW
jgi:hypothetical protein